MLLLHLLHQSAHPVLLRLELGQLLCLGFRYSANDSADLGFLCLVLLLGGLVLRVSVQISVIILVVRFGTGRVRRQVRRCGGVLSCLLERGVATPPGPVP